MIKEFAEWLDLTIWDWIAVTVSFCSLLVAVLSFIIARQTLKSQRQTEKNTMPIINVGIQELLLNELILKLLDGHIRITALWYLLNEKKYVFYLSEHILEKIHIPIDTIHVDLFYGNKQQYRTMQGLLDMIKNYNVGIGVLNSHLKNKSIVPEVLNNEFYYLINTNDRIAEMWGKVMSLMYGYEANEKSEIFNIFLGDITDDLMKNTEILHYKNDEVYSQFFVDIEMKKKIIVFMENKTIILMKEFSNFLIEK